MRSSRAPSSRPQPSDSPVKLWRTTENAFCPFTRIRCSAKRAEQLHASYMRATAAARSKGMNVRIEIGRVEVAGLAVARTLHEFIEREALPGSGVTAQEFWGGLAALIGELGPRNRKLLAL